MTRIEYEPSPRIHHVACGVWKAPEPASGSLILNTNEALAAYLASVEPVFKTMAVLIAQMGLMLMLSSGQRPNSRRTSDVSHNLMQAELKEVEARLRGLSIPDSAAQHHWVLSEVTRKLDEILAQLSTFVDINVSKCSKSHKDISRGLRHTHDMLRKAVIPQAGLVTIDVTQACCNCTHHKPASADHSLV